MQLCTDPHTKEHYSFDSQAYLRFLVDQGFTEQEINALTVYLECEPNEAIQRTISPNILGYYSSATHTIRVWSRNGSVTTMDNTLLHETRHYWQHSHRTHRFSAAKRIAYLDRPHEIDARQFADTHAGQHFFQRIVKLSPMDEAGLALVAGMVLFSCVLAIGVTIQRLVKA